MPTAIVPARNVLDSQIAYDFKHALINDLNSYQRIGWKDKFDDSHENLMPPKA